MTVVDGAQSINFLDAEDIVAVEVYRGIARVPVQYGRMANRCGIVLSWTKG